MSENVQSKPLSGIKIIELSTMITASMAALMLSDQGAEVIKVEDTSIGDPMRYLGMKKGGISALFANCNRGKKSISVNLKQAQGREILEKLAKEADVLVHNFRPGVMDQLGLGSDALRKNNPRLIYTAISGFGTDGPLATKPAYDPVVQAAAGFTAVQGVGEEPAFMRTLICDKITAYTACQSITAALLARTQTGQGQHLDIAMLDASLFFLWPDGMMNHTLLDDDVPVLPPLSAIYRTVQTTDGFITLSAATEKQWQGMLRAISREDLIDDPRLADISNRAQNAEVVSEIMRESFAKFNTQDILARLHEQDVPAAECLGFEAAIQQPQLDSNETIQRKHHPLMGDLRVLRYPTRFNGQAMVNDAPCPTLGQDTAQVLASLGYDAEKLPALVADGVIPGHVVG